MNFNIDSQTLYPFLIGVSFIVFVLIRRINDGKVFRNAIETDGVVIHEELEVSNTGDRLYSAIIKFQLKDGEWITAKDRNSHYPKKYLDNNNVKIEYSVDDHSQIRVKGSDRQINLVFLAIGAILTAYSFYLYIAAR
ncbi:DUF3592 domain-containing protein [Mucilaginibacter agri]|uniref:DUF3592 domain-containing protein n=1 Tax=Mucilaginibacter agri TaxID=2695265 RepID=A0A965ZH33_9SPHI|nr:DUF3592 domain-containing protein [Mucilaginibacter agri]NCD69869.1 hypothetical protein [Mucilaginibacter agri]